MKRSNHVGTFLLDHLTLKEDGLKHVARGWFYPAFKATWNRIPIESQRAIKTFFKHKPGKVFLCYKMDYGNLPVEPLGRCFWFEDTTVITFLAPFIQHAELKGVMGVIGHELAHCARKGAGIWKDNTEQEEKDTRALADAWGFIDPYPDQRTWKLGIEGWQKRNMKLRHLAETLQIQR